MVGCSTAGEIECDRVVDDSAHFCAIEFERSSFHTASADVNGNGDSYDAAKRVAASLPHEGLRHILVFSEGVDVNGSRLVAGLEDELPDNVSITGGLAGDADRFEETFVLCGREPKRGMLSVAGLYGDDLQIGYGTQGGWDSFGPVRMVTRSEDNVVYELDGKPALEIYKKYLGEQAADLPASGLLFPLAVRKADTDREVVRTILGVDESTNSLTFAGDIPMGSRARLMRANFDRLVDGAACAAQDGRSICSDATEPSLALLVSCVGRKLILRQRVDDEIEAVREVLGTGPTFTGFYSYGEISPVRSSTRSALHNQSMTVTTLGEVS